MMQYLRALPLLVALFVGDGVSNFAVSEGEIVVARACEPRRTVDPGRLNVDSRADFFGSIAPCSAELNLYIARNTPLRSLHGHLVVEDPNGETIRTKNLRVAFRAIQAGIYAVDYPIASIEGHRCLDLTIELTVTQCADEDGQRINCPDIRVMTPDTFAALTIAGGGLDICHAD